MQRREPEFGLHCAAVAASGWRANHVPPAKLRGHQQSGAKLQKVCVFSGATAVSQRLLLRQLVHPLPYFHALQ